MHPKNPVGAEATSGWLGDWKSLNQSRSQYAIDLRRHVGHPELLLKKDGGAPITKRMNDFAGTHELIGCESHNLQAEIVDGARNYPRDPTEVR